MPPSAAHFFAEPFLLQICTAIPIEYGYKHEDVYLKGYATLPELLLGLTEYFVFYAPKEVLLGDNTQRTHQSLDYSTPDAVYQTASGGGASIVDKFTEREKVRSEKDIKAETEPGQRRSTACDRLPS